MEVTGPDWVLSAKRVPVCGVADFLPRVPGLYAVFIDDPCRLPDPFREIAEARAIPHLLYIGQASKSLYRRVWIQEFQHKGPGTFFRSTGVMLGYVSPTGGRHFAFTPPDKSGITAWIAEHLAVAWTVSVQNTNGEEHDAILQHCPLLNIKRNPRKIVHLEKLRAISQRGVRRPI